LDGPFRWDALKGVPYRRHSRDALTGVPYLPAIPLASISVTGLQSSSRPCHENSALSSPSSTRFIM